MLISQKMWFKPLYIISFLDYELACWSDLAGPTKGSIFNFLRSDGSGVTFWISYWFPFFLDFRSLPKLTAHEDEGVHQNPQYTGQHHFHPVVHDHDYCERVIVNVSLFLHFYLTLTHTPVFQMYLEAKAWGPICLDFTLRKPQKFLWHWI